MRIWIDLTNSPHVSFFASLIEELESKHDVLITARPLADTIELLKQRKFKYHVVGSHYGANRVKKGLGFGVRVLQLCSFISGRQVDVAISHSSFYSPFVARILGIRSIYINDNEHAEGNRISFLCASTIMVPEFFPIDRVRKQWGKPKKVVHYPGVKEGIYLSGLLDHVNKRAASVCSVPEIFIRPEPWTAQYYRGSVFFMDELIIGLKDKYLITLMPRGDQQAKHYRQARFSGIKIPEKPLTLEDMASRCSLFIGAGGTMTREAAVMGIPTLSVYQGELLAVDRYLLEQGYMTHRQQLTPNEVESFIEICHRKLPSKELLHKGSIASDMIREILLQKYE